MIDLCEIWFWSYNSRLIWFHIVNRSLRLVSHGLVPIGAPKMEIIAIIILALIVAAFAVYALRNGTKSSVPPASVEVEAEKMRLASEVERLQAAEGRANDLQVHTVALERDLENERALLKKLEEEHRVKDKKVEELTQQIQQASTKNATLSEQLESKTNSFKDALQRVRDLESETKQQQDRVVSLTSDKTKLEGSLKDLNDRLEERAVLEKRFAESFKALSSDTLAVQGKRFMENADANLKEREAAVEKLVKPLSDKIETLEKGRVDSAAALRQQIDTLVKANNTLSEQTQTLSSALTHRPQIRGQWGEMQVERVLELSGLTKGLHYETQASDQQGGRTDFIVHMPHKRDIILDSKVSLNAYLESQNTESDEARDTALARHARSMRSHADDLAKKEYWQSLPDTADFVVMVVPEFALPPAVERDPDLLDRALQNKVVIATHSTLVALLKCVAMGWQERTVADEALQIGELGKELYDRLSVFAGHLTGVGTALGNAVSRYNQSVGSFDSRVISQARRFSELGVKSTKELPEAKIVDAAVRSPRHMSDTSSSGNHALSDGNDVNNGPSDLSDDGREHDSRLAQAFSSDDASS